MEPTESGTSSGSYDKNKVLDVKPLRCLAPMFAPPPLGSQSTPPFVCAPPFGPFPAGYSPFYPFFNPSDPQRPPPEQQHPQSPSGATNQAGVFGYNNHPVQTQLPSFRTPPPPPPLFVSSMDGGAGPSNKGSKKQDAGLHLHPGSVSKGDSVISGSEDEEWSNHQKREELHPRIANKGDPTRSASEEDGWSNNHKRTANLLSSINMNSTDVEGTSNGERQKSKSHKRIKNSEEIKFFAPADGDSESVGRVLMKYDAVRRRLSQIEDAREKDSTSGNKRPDLKAGTIMMSTGLRTNTRKRTGTVPGVEIGDIFFFRIEMCLVGLHAPIMAGIDYMGLKFDQEEETVAVSIVSSGGYEDDMEDKDVLIYSGQGGNANKKDGKYVADQKLERGNLALERSLRRGNDVRVIRGMKDVGNSTGKVYVYDGLYKIQESWMEKARSGCNVFKYKLLRVPGQPEAFAIWKSIQQWKGSSISRPGLILPDLTSGAEKLPVSLVNDIDDEKGPSHFAYFPSLKYSKPVNLMKLSVGCNCRSSCIPGDPNCSCVMKNGGDLPYTANSILVTQKPLIHECGPSCLCHPNCRNQVAQNGLKVRLEVFKTKDRGWGLRSWDPIRAGAFICEYAGQVIDKIKVEEDRDEDEDDYMFDATCTRDKSFEWNYMPELLGEERPGDMNEAFKPLSLIISAKFFGNVARFMNHSCTPNVFWQPVLYEHNDESYPHVMFYAIRHIPPMAELTYDYGLGGTRSRNVHGRRKSCLCGSSNCRGYFG